MDEQFHSGLVLTISGQSTQASNAIVTLEVTEAWTPLMAIGRDGKVFFFSYNNNARADRRCLDWPRDRFSRKIPVICSFNEFLVLPQAMSLNFYL